jgi:hypothetical protein
MASRLAISFNEAELASDIKSIARIRQKVLPAMVHRTGGARPS